MPFQRKFGALQAPATNPSEFLSGPALALLAYLTDSQRSPLLLCHLLPFAIPRLLESRAHLVRSTDLLGHLENDFELNRHSKRQAGHANDQTRRHFVRAKNITEQV